MSNEITLSLAIIAVVQFIKKIPGGETVKGWATIIIAAVLGLLAGFSGFQGLTWFSGLLAGLMSVGTMTIGETLGSKTKEPDLG